MAKASTAPKEAEKKVNVTPVNNEPKQTMYIGPAIRGVISRHYTYADAPSEDEINRIAAKANVTPGIVRGLIVPVTELAKAMNDLNNPQSKVSICYKKILN